MLEEAKGISDMFLLTDRVAVLTGGAGSLGRKYLAALLGAGARVVVADIRTEELDDLARETGNDADRLFCLQVDISCKDQVERMFEAIRSRWGRIDILINNAAIDPKFDAENGSKQNHTFEDYPLELWQRSLDVNLTGAFLCSQAAGRIMIQQGAGVIVNISSTYGIVAPDQSLYEPADGSDQTLFKPADYAVTKAGIAHLTRYLAVYWGKKNIRVNTLTPGGVYIAQAKDFVTKYAARTPMGRMARIDELCGALLFLVSDASSYMTGANLVVDGGWTAW